MLLLFFCVFPMWSASADWAYITQSAQNEYEEWHLPVRTYLVDDYLESFQCTGLAQYCKGYYGDYCAYKFTNGSIECIHTAFIGGEHWSHDGHSYCNCQDLTCKKNAHFVSCDDGKQGGRGGCQKVRGGWASDSFSSAPQEVTFKEGFTKTSEWGWETTHEFSASVTRTVSAGLEVEGVGTAGKELSTELSETLSQTMSHSWGVEYSEETEHTYSFPAGQVWRWIFHVISPCGNSTVYTNNLVNTNSRVESPCCLPGMFKKATDPRGKCLAGPRLCSDEVVV